jgi:hypothetical protein
MKVALAVLVSCGLWLPLFAQTSPSTFTSPDRVFRFQYSRLLVRCIPEPSQEGYSGSWDPADACMSQAGVCDDAASSDSTVVCFAYPKNKFKDKPTFSAAAFFVAEVRKATTQANCLAGSKYWRTPNTANVTINGLRFKLFHISDSWLSGGQVGDIYRVFHRKRCYELGIQQAGTSLGAYGAGTIKEFTKRDQGEVHACLKQTLDSFRFLK